MVFVTAFGTIDDAVGAIKGGAYSYLTKPVDPERLRITIRRPRSAQLSREVRTLRAQMDERDEIVAVSREMRHVLDTVAQVAGTDATVLITGESGTGKELVARAYTAQPAARRPFVAMNCARDPARPPGERAVRAREGRVHRRASREARACSQQADGGTLFLDEIGECSRRCR